MNPRFFLCAFLALPATGCFRITVDGDGVRYGSEHERVSVQRHGAGTVAADTQSVAVENEFGQVMVTGVDGDYGWDWDLTAWGKDTAAAEARADKLKLETVPVAGGVRLRLVSESARNEPGRFESAIRVRVPKAASVDVKNVFGAVEVTALSGAATVHAQHGKVSVSQVRGSVTASTAFAELAVAEVGPAELQNQNGSIRAQSVSGPLKAGTSFAGLSAVGIQGNATLANQNGAIEAEQVKGELEAKTSFATLRVRDISGPARLKNQNGEVLAEAVAGAIQAETSFNRMELTSASHAFDARNQNGAILITVTGEGAERINASTSFSPIEVRLPASAKPVIRAETSFGRIRSDFPVLVWDSISDHDFEADPARPKLTLRAQNADIQVRRREAR